MPTPTKSQNSTVCGQGGPFHSYQFLRVFAISAFLKVIHALFLGILGAWMTFKKAEMKKKLSNGLSLSEMDPLNHKQLDFAI